jgi:HEPN domain-containing protein
MDVAPMEDMFAKKRYDWALFVGHLVLEKLFKALFVKINGKDISGTKIHKLLTLAERAKLELSDELKVKLSIITEFNIEARYQDYKNNFYKKCTAKYSSKWIKEIKELRKWLKSLI